MVLDSKSSLAKNKIARETKKDLRQGANNKNGKFRHINRDLGFKNLHEGDFPYVLFVSTIIGC